MIHFKGLEVSEEIVGLIKHMDGVDGTREALQSLQGVWDTLALLGQLSGSGVEIDSVRSAFSGLTSQLINQLGLEALRKASHELQSKAQVSVDVLVRNLFERTADIGFLATDEDLRQFANASPAEREQARPALLERLREYQRKYSVYEDIVLLGLDGTVLARLAPQGTATRTQDDLLATALHTPQAFVETFEPSDLRPDGARTLIYSYRVMSSDGRQPLAVLCLHFRFADECHRIFDGLGHPDDWSVMTLLDGVGHVIATSDAIQVPLGVRLQIQAGDGPQVLRFAGRHWLAATCAAHAYQGYPGPGWRGHVMVPLEQAFGQQALLSLDHLDPEVLETLMSSPRLFSDELRRIPRTAEQIEADLARAVWNGNVTLDDTANDRDARFAKTLLREVGRTGGRTREVFTAAIAEMNRTVVAATVGHAATCAAQAIDIMDRNLYERANDCRWWALTTAFRQALEAPSVTGTTRDALTRILQTIHGLYTVYDNLVLFDRTGVVVAASRTGDATAPGQPLNEEWVGRTLALADTQGYAVSRFAPTPLYGGRHSYIYGAAVRSLSAPQEVVGGIGIVFDAEPQFNAMLIDTLPRDAQARATEGAFSAFVDREGTLIAASRADLRPGTALPMRMADLPALHAGSPGQRHAATLLPLDGVLYAVGTRLSEGYREYKGEADPYRNDITALVCVPLAEHACATDAAHRRPALQALLQPALARRDEARIELATFAVGGQWYALPTVDVAEAIGSQRILPLPGTAAHVRGSVMRRGAPLAVLDLPRLLNGGQPTAGTSSLAQIVVVKAGPGRPSFGMLVDALGDTPEVAQSRLDRLSEVCSAADALVEHVVKPTASSEKQPLLMVLSAQRLGAALSAPRTQTSTAVV